MDVFNVCLKQYGVSKYWEQRDKTVRKMNNIKFINTGDKGIQDEVSTKPAMLP